MKSSICPSFLTDIITVTSTYYLNQVVLTSEYIWIQLKLLNFPTVEKLQYYGFNNKDTDSILLRYRTIDFSIGCLKLTQQGGEVGIMLSIGTKEEED